MFFSHNKIASAGLSAAKTIRRTSIPKGEKLWTKVSPFIINIKITKFKLLVKGEEFVVIVTIVWKFFGSRKKGGVNYGVSRRIKSIMLHIGDILQAVRSR